MLLTKWRLSLSHTNFFLVKQGALVSSWQKYLDDERSISLYSYGHSLLKIIYPVRAGIIAREEDYLYSSASDYAGLKSPVNVAVLNLHSLMS
jgi:hypothetical protein